MATLKPKRTLDDASENREELTAEMIRDLFRLGKDAYNELALDVDNTLIRPHKLLDRNLKLNTKRGNDYLSHAIQDWTRSSIYGKWEPVFTFGRWGDDVKHPLCTPEGLQRALRSIVQMRRRKGSLEGVSNDIEMPDAPTENRAFTRHNGRNRRLSEASSTQTPSTSYDWTKTTPTFEAVEFADLRVHIKLKRKAPIVLVPRHLVTGMTKDGLLTEADINYGVTMEKVASLLDERDCDLNLKFNPNTCSLFITLPGTGHCFYIDCTERLRAIVRLALYRPGILFGNILELHITTLQKKTYVERSVLGSHIPLRELAQSVGTILNDDAYREISFESQPEAPTADPFGASEQKALGASAAGGEHKRDEVDSPGTTASNQTIRIDLTLSKDQSMAQMKSEHDAGRSIRQPSDKIAPHNREAWVKRRIIFEWCELVHPHQKVKMSSFGGRGSFTDEQRYHNDISESLRLMSGLSLHPNAAYSHQGTLDLETIDATVTSSHKQKDTGVFHELLSGTKLEHQMDRDGEDFAAFNFFFDLHPPASMLPDTKIKLNEIKLSLYPYQLFCVFWVALGRARDPLPVKFICDIPGLGKTAECLVHAWLFAQVEQNPFWTNRAAALVDKYGEAYRITPQPGFNAIWCPPSLVGNWAAEAIKFLDIDTTPLSEPSKKRNFRIILGADPPSNENAKFLRGKGVTLMKNHKDADLKRFFLDPDERMQDASFTFIIASRESFPGQVFQRFWKLGGHKAPSQAELQGAVDIPWARNYMDEAHDQGTLGTRTQQLMAAMEGEKGKPAVSFVFASATPFEKSPADMVGCFVTASNKHLYSTNGNANTSVTLPTGEESKVKVLLKKGITKQDLVNLGDANPLKVFAQGTAVALCAARRAKGNMKEDDHSKMANGIAYFNRLTQQYMIRRDERSLWFGKPVVEFPWAKATDVEVECTPPITEEKMRAAYLLLCDRGQKDWNEQISRKQDAWRLAQTVNKPELKEQLKRDQKLSAELEKDMPTLPDNDKFEKGTAILIRIADVFPVLSEELYHNERDTLWNATLSRELYEARRSSEDHWLWKEYGKKLHLHSPKLDAVKRIIVETFAKLTIGEKNKGKDQKLLIFATHGIIAELTQLVIERTWGYGASCRIAVTYDKGAANRSGIVRGFQENKDHRILVSTNKIMGTGFTLTAATTVILLDVNYMRREEIQQIGRILRIASVQLEPCIYAYCLISKSGRLDVILRARQDARADVIKGALGSKQYEQELDALRIKYKDRIAAAEVRGLAATATGDPDEEEPSVPEEEPSEEATVEVLDMEKQTMIELNDDGEEVYAKSSDDEDDGPTLPNIDGNPDE